MLKPKNVSFTVPQFSFSDSWSPEANSKWTLQRPTQWVRGLHPPTGRSYNASWGLLTFTVGSSEDSAPSYYHLPDLPLLRYRSDGPPKPKLLLWLLRPVFSTAPILIMPNPEKQFILGAVLSQRAMDGKVHPCAYFSRHLSSAERNYAVGDRELLALKLALEEWRHLLEGSTVPFLVWTDHRNLEYLHTAKLLNPRQARWSLFFNRFNFTLSYRPGSKNIKPDALSRLHHSPSDV